ncbi:hypothetical protein [Vagococcus fluvialis]|uniref:hypothetical protein n=1 Tax=Vagococcus fluvialis TaxID=2738 RepID=UPI001D09F95E|nr:hypothetical protein [Vagococcus fluvialis]UDM74061.1 hypothetical protein K5K99_00025 [Vagococcus fluvialis]
MILTYKQSTLNKIKELEKYVKEKKTKHVYFVEMNEDNTYSEDRWTKEELDQHIKDKGYQVVFIDDIPNFE